MPRKDVEFSQRTLPETNRKKIVQQYAQASKEEIDIICTINDLLPNFIHIDEIYNGAYALIPDEGSLYRYWCSFASSKPRRSSHESADQEHSLYGVLLKECLFGTRVIAERKYTWVQLERYGLNHSDLPKHMWTYVLYSISGSNIGPYGSSYYTEDHPLQLARPLSEQTREMEGVDQIEMCHLRRRFRIEEESDEDEKSYPSSSPKKSVKQD